MKLTSTLFFFFKLKPKKEKKKPSLYTCDTLGYFAGDFNITRHTNLRCIQFTERQN